VASATSASRSHESAATGSAGASPATQPAADITAITTRDDLLLELGQTLGGQASVRPVDSLEAALEAMARGKRGQVLVVDARDVANVRAAVDAVHAAAPRAVVLVFAEGAAELSTSLRGSKVFAVLPMPLDARKTQAVVEGALAEAVAKHAPAAPASKPPSSPRSELSVEEFEPQGAVSERSNRGRRRGLVLHPRRKCPGSCNDGARYDHTRNRTGSRRGASGYGRGNSGCSTADRNPDRAGQGG